MKEYIYEKKGSLSNVLCKSIISVFEDKNVKKFENREQVSFRMETDINKERWKLYDSYLFQELNKSFNEYKIKINKNFLYDNATIHDTGFLIQKLKKLKGNNDEIRNDEHSVDKDYYRIMTYIWFLNDVKEGGNMIFDNKYVVKPEIGKIIIFPSSWSFAYTQETPISEDKYIIIGGFYRKNNNA